MNVLRYLMSITLILFLFTACKKDDNEPKDDTNNNNNGGNTGGPSANTVNETALLDLVNRLRGAGCNCGSTAMPPVGNITWNNTLESAAYLHSKDMLDNDYFSHTSESGTNPGQRITAAGYSWKTYGENIAFGYPTEQSVFDGWLGSEGHCKNMMGRNFKEIGVGRAGNYWTMNLAAQ